MITAAGKSVSTGVNTCTYETQRECTSSGEDKGPFYIYATHDVPDPLHNKALNSMVKMLFPSLPINIESTFINVLSNRFRILIESGN
jgi:hypothetical protein